MLYTHSTWCYLRGHPLILILYYCPKNMKYRWLYFWLRSWQIGKETLIPPLSDFLFRVILIKRQSINEFISFEIHFCLHRTRGPFY